MSSQNFDMPTYIYILNAESNTSDGADINNILSKSGQLAFLGTGLTEEGSAAANGTDYFFGAKTTGGTLIKSPAFDPATIVNGTFTDAIARTEQVSYVGYNGTSGSLDSSNSTYYSLGIVLNHTFGLLNNSPLVKTIPFKSTAATQSNIAAGLANAGVKAFERDPIQTVKFERINAGAADTALGDITATNGSKNITSGTDDTSNISVGSIIRMGGTGAGTNPCYVVESHDSGSGAARIYTLDQPFQGTTVAAESDAETVTEGNWGLKLTGVSCTDANFDPINDTPFVVNFDVELNENFTTASVTYDTASDIGNGTYQLVAYDEAMSLFNDKDRHISAYPRQPNHTFEATSNGSAGTYTTIEFEASDSKYSSTTTGLEPKSKFRVKIYHETTDASTDYGVLKGTVLTNDLVDMTSI